MNLKKIKNNHVLIIIGILTVSFIMNIFVSWENITYKYRVGKASYTSCEDIRSKNKSNIDIMENTIKLGSINNEELLQVYKNYEVIVASIMSLSDDYNFYKSKSIMVFSKGNIKGDQLIKNEVYVRIQDFILKLLNYNMQNGQYTVKIQGNLETDLKVLLDLAKQLEAFYEDFGIKVLHSSKDEEKESKVIKNEYWIDMLEGIDKLSAEYRDYEFQSIKDQMKKN